MSPQDIQQLEKEARVQIENAIAGIAREREALQRDRRLDPALIAQNIERYQEIMLNHLQWLNTHGFVASVSGGVLSMRQKEDDTERGTPTWH